MAPPFGPRKPDDGQVVLWSGFIQCLRMERSLIPTDGHETSMGRFGKSWPTKKAEKNSGNLICTLWKLIDKSICANMCVCQWSKIPFVHLK